KNSFFDRSILIDVDKKSFTVLSKLHGDIKTEFVLNEQVQVTYLQGGVKKISAAASFFNENNRFIFKETILATPKEEKVFDKKFIDYLFEFHNLRRLMGCYYYMKYECKKNNLLKQLLIQDRASGDLADFITKNNLKEKSIWKHIFAMMVDISYGLD